ncbi:unnamed protein product [Strongylus vulgaris]|uniref:Uncharacterized protein n=1 Tax=Strongylus vulgaris TaxID=40348 RepID=A0A3P7JCH1_STRVU|nr:unnamed protein product [Strongylus vulgaris]
MTTTVQLDLDKENNSLQEEAPFSDIFDFCPFEPVDPWREEIARYVDDSNGFKNCNVQGDFLPLTELVNGTLILKNTNSDASCKGRCLIYINDEKYKTTEWREVNSEFHCDFVETECNLNRSEQEDGILRFVHKQIVEQRNSSEERLSMHDHPDVHIIIFDSVGSSQFIRYVSQDYYTCK